jgi:hypothetical protein
VRKTSLWMSIFCGVAVFVAIAAAQSVRKPGLWEITSTITWQQSPLAESSQAHAGDHAAMSPPVPATSTSPLGLGTQTSKVCLTQEMIDKYGAPLPQSRDCHIENLVKTETSMKGDWVCTARMQGRGTIESTRTEQDQAKGKIHFIGTMQLTSGPKAVEFTIESTSKFESPDCGQVKPLPMPPEK